jgi:hypothetical protein
MASDCYAYFKREGPKLDEGAPKRPVLRDER